jgi:integrase/recombinase XerD
MATQYILNGGDAFSLQKILGHSCLDMVRVYVGLANRDVALQHRKFSPIDHMGLVPGERRQVRLK